MISILIVEDNASITRMIRELVGDLTDCVDQCNDGLQAVRLYRLRQPDWVLMDVEAAGFDGIEATRRIRQDFPAANILMVGNYDDSRMREAAMQAGARAYVHKENLLEVRRLLIRAQFSHRSRQFHLHEPSERKAQ